MTAPTYAGVSDRVREGIGHILTKIGPEADALIHCRAALLDKAFAGDLDAASDAAMIVLREGQTGLRHPLDALCLADVLLRRVATQRGAARDHMGLGAVSALAGIRERALGNDLGANLLDAEALVHIEAAAAAGDASADAIVPELVAILDPQACAFALQFKPKD